LEVQRATETRLVGVHGVRVIAAGLDAGRAYVEIAAHSTQAADFAEDALRAIANVSDESWSHGWAKRGVELTIRIYPG
jgi:hypothetical protein